MFSSKIVLLFISTISCYYSNFSSNNIDYIIVHKVRLWLYFNDFIQTLFFSRHYLNILFFKTITDSIDNHRCSAKKTYVEKCFIWQSMTIDFFCCCRINDVYLYFFFLKMKQREVLVFFFLSQIWKKIWKDDDHKRCL